MVLPELVVCDFAGTVMRDDGAVLNAYRAALTEHRIDFTEAELASRRGANKRAVFHELAGRGRSPDEGAALGDRALAIFESALRREFEHGDVQEIFGATDALRTLKGAHIKLALTSGFDRSLVDLLVGRLGLGDLFDLVLSGSDAPMGRPAPFFIYRAMMELRVIDVAWVAVVGDTVLDLQAGSHAHAGWVIGVTSGAHSAEMLGMTHHTHLLPSVASLPGLFGLAQ